MILGDSLFVHGGLYEEAIGAMPGEAPAVSRLKTVARGAMASGTD